MTIPVRPATPADAAAMADVINPLIREGTTTAIATEFTVAAMERKIFRDLDLVCCHVALDPEGRVAGFQWLSRVEGFPADWGDIATFARPAPKLPGVGRALFAATRDAATKARLTAITARIRADNAGGLVYYGKMGFQDHDVVTGVPLKDGTPMDRITKLCRL
ncbi:GNAT family N-acetyltransferase [Oceaniglobus roseus]|uniref:GNAT family N-acetyltransferase n=1 Tax=Oceaniglobus roseus TaxID=1737570 RepID=UPI000C7EAD0C|nr:GNAT family N-acetyltransferase [Kandeliimicrobium roseum]